MAHDAYARVYAAMRQQVINQPKAFLFTTARRLAFNQVKRRRISPLDDWALGQAEQVAEDAPSIERIVVAREEWARLETAILALPPGCRTVLLLCKLERLSHAQVGERLGIAVSTVEKQHARALRLLDETAPLGIPLRGGSPAAFIPSERGSAMKTDGMPDHRAIDAAAALWAARMESGELSGADRETLRAWLEQDPAHRWRLAHYQHYSAELDVALPALSAAGKVRLAASPPRRKGRHWGYVSLAAMVALAVAIGIYWRPTAGERGPVFSTHIAERQSVKLADGTRADLNAQTNLAVEFQKSERRVRLDHGEVLFTVAKNLARPFVVETPGGRVRVTGTVFNVRTDLSGQFEVSVLEGHVEVQPLGGVASPEPLRLGVGDHVSLNADPRSCGAACRWRESRMLRPGGKVRRFLSRSRWVLPSSDSPHFTGKSSRSRPPLRI